MIISPTPKERLVHLEQYFRVVADFGHWVRKGIKGLLLKFHGPQKHPEGRIVIVIHNSVDRMSKLPVFIHPRVVIFDKYLAS